MANQIFINLPVKDTSRSITFFEKLGFSRCSIYGSENTECMAIAENMYVMLMEENSFKSFSKKEICDTANFAQVVIEIGVDSHEKVEEMVRLAREAGGKVPFGVLDQGWRYGHGFQDIDGHYWEIMFMDPDAKNQG